MSRYFPDRSDKADKKGSVGAYASNNVKLNKPGKYLDAWLNQADYKDISGKVDRAASVNGGLSGKLPTRDHSNRADRLASKYPSKALGKEGDYRGVKGRKSY